METDPLFPALTKGLMVKGSRPTKNLYILDAVLVLMAVWGAVFYSAAPHTVIRTTSAFKIYGYFLGPGTFVAQSQNQSMATLLNCFNFSNLLMTHFDHH